MRAPLFQPVATKERRREGIGRRLGLLPNRSRPRPQHRLADWAAPEVVVGASPARVLWRRLQLLRGSRESDRVLSVSGEVGVCLFPDLGRLAPGWLPGLGPWAPGPGTPQDGLRAGLEPGCRSSAAPDGPNCRGWVSRIPALLGLLVRVGAGKAGTSGIPEGADLAVGPESQVPVCSPGSRASDSASANNCRSVERPLLASLSSWTKDLLFCPTLSHSNTVT